MLKDSAFFKTAAFLLSNCGRAASPSTIEKNGYVPDIPLLDALKDKKIDSLYYLLYDPDNQQQLLYKKVWEIQSACLTQLLDALKNAGIEVIVFKGAEFVAGYYDNNPLGYMNDLDLFIRKEQISDAQKVFYEAGFFHGYIELPGLGYKLLNIADIATVILGHYELPPLNKAVEAHLTPTQQQLISEKEQHPIWSGNGKFIIFPEFDVHYQLATDIIGDDLFSRSIQSSFGTARTFDPADTLWFTLSKFYNEVALYGKKSLRDFAYILALLNKEEINWDLFLKSVHEYKLYSIYYFLSFCSFLLENRIPPAVLKEIEKGMASGLRDWGWQIERLFNKTPVSPF